jgi:hypothetical protein
VAIVPASFGDSAATFGSDNGGSLAMAALICAAAGLLERLGLRVRL